MQRVAETVWEQLSSKTKLVSYERRLQRFVANERMEVETCWNAFLQQVLPCWETKPVKLILDTTPSRDEAPSVSVGLLMHSRVLPVAWGVMPPHQKWEQGPWEIVGHLFEQVAASFRSARCTLVADRGLRCLS